MNMILEVAQARSSNEVSALAANFCSRLEFDNFVVAVGTSDSDVPSCVLHNLPDSWLAIATDEIRHRDPIFRLLRQSRPPPIAWSRPLFALTDTLDIWDLFAEHGMRSGFDIPISTSSTNRFVLSLIRDGELPKRFEMAEKLAKAATFAHCLSAVAMDIIQAELFADRLSPVQRRLLQYCLDGLSIEDIADETALTIRAVKQRFTTICRLAGDSVQTPMAAATLYGRTQK
ncbi:helix-turn-helix transcriptional regulator [Parachitinimonas caeni]|uniref:Autoinducer binding domain-containing protein n=1 Tax=Parachitinimonas caeni TaxID=3031301 RepID=A0ABT7E541_9NEIS|nr:autoinducer binding domain-containing protein [Parachitinimonas caeni]MDK2126488.1 autoinducer binding domain-containing protein [Parachitinimonas caeni]